jgi:homoserine/homoserine lactone efflux protein
MTLHSWMIYISLVCVATATPGPAVLYIMATSTMHGPKKCIFAALGNISGLLILGIVAVSGLGAVLKTSLIVFSVVKYAGAAYLIYLGIKLVLEKGEPAHSAGHTKILSQADSGKVYFQALGIALSNPKAIVFLTALFPQFIDIDRALFPQFSHLITTLMLFSFFFLMSYALVAHRAKQWINGPGRVKWFRRAGGSAFIGFGLMLAGSSNR